MKKMSELSELLNSMRSQSPSSKNAQQLVNNRLMRSKQSNKKSFKKQEQQPPTKSDHISPIKIVRESKIHQIDQRVLTLLKQMFLRKCKNLQIGFNSQKFNEFLQKYVNKNEHNPNHKIDLCDLNLVSCQEQLNKLIMYKSVRDINLSKSVLRPSLLCLQTIERLYLNNCNLGNAQMQSLFNRLIQSNKIIVLSLSSREVNDKNHLTRYDKLYELMVKCVTLKELYLSNCSIDKDNKIFEYIKGSSIKVVDLSYNEKVIGMSHFLEVLNLQGNQLIKPDALFQKDSKHSTQLKSLNISHNQINQYDLKIFLLHNYLGKLQQLRMNNIKIREECECLQEFISYSNCLQKLSVVDCSFGEQSWMNFILGMKMNSSLREVNLSKNFMSNKQVAKTFGQMLGSSRLKKLKMSQCLIKDQLGSLIFSNLGKNRHLQHLDISKNKFSNQTGMNLSSSLKTNHVLKLLNIQDNCISYTITKELMEYTSRNSFLVTRLLNKEHSQLIELNEQEKDINQELEQLTNSLLEKKHDHSLTQQRLRQMKAENLSKQIEHQKKLIQQYLNQEKELLREIEHVQAIISSQQAMDDDSSREFS